MPKTIHRNEYRVLLRMIKGRRLRAGLTQAECSAALGRSQSFISDVERGVRRLDVVQLRDLCGILKTDLRRFVADFERELDRGRG
jgi:transcriptional regulator with XRE-family HTH domain